MKVLILDGLALVRDALSRVLASLMPGVIVLEAADPASAFITVEREPDLDLVLLDLALPGMHGPASAAVSARVLAAAARP
jgi:CheY-like chemotaxis protein